MNKNSIIALTAIIAIGLACKGLDKKAENSAPTNAANAVSNKANTTSGTPVTTKSAGEFVTSESGTAKSAPEAGKANVQGKVTYNGKPEVGIEVRLCEKFSQYVVGCSGEKFTTKTDENGEFFLANVTPRTYETLMVKVFNTRMWVFATYGYAGMNAKYDIKADTTFFVPETSLFKDDLKVTAPKSASKIEGAEAKLTWNAYPDAAYYKVNLYPKETSVQSKYIGEKVEATEFVCDEGLEPGEWTLKVEAYNANDVKLSDSGDGVKFKVNGAAAAAPANTAK